MLGIGLGGFVDGFAKGYGLREDIKDREIAREERAEDRAFRAEEMQFRREDRAYQQEERGFARSERQRQLDQRGRIDAINTDTRAAFGEAVEAGEAKEDESEKFWAEYALPRMQTELILQNDMEGARALTDWSETKAAKDGRKLFSSAIFKANTGDHEGALDDAIAAGRLGGYIGDGFDIAEKEEITDEAGNVLGFRLTMKDKDGNETQQDIALDDVPAAVSQFANPQAAWDSQMATRAKETERETEFEDFERRERLKADLDGGGGESRTAAIKALREQYKPDVTNEDAVAFDAMPREDQERLIQQELDLQAGSSRPVAPAAQVIVDSRNGQPVADAPVPSANPSRSAPGLGQSPAAAASPAPGMGIGGPPRANAVINGVEDPGLPAPSTPAEMLDMAAQQMVNGGDPQEIARTLRAMNIPQDQWPQSVTRPLTQTGR